MFEQHPLLFMLAIFVGAIIGTLLGLKVAMGNIIKKMNED